MGSTIHMLSSNTNQIIGEPWHSFSLLALPKQSSMPLSQIPVFGSTAAPLATKTVPRTSPSLVHVWREIQGSKNWENLTEPLNPLLRREIIRYGEFITACYKAFNLNPSSKRYLHCKYARKNMLKEVGMMNSGYEVTRYIYAAPNINVAIHNGICRGRWIGFVAVSSDEKVKRLGRRDIVIVFRGTVTNPEWIANFMSSLTPARLDPLNAQPDVKVELGFLTLYTSEDSDCKLGVKSCREQLLSEVSRIINEYKREEISITISGHSMGSSIALLLAYDIAELGLNKYFPSQEIPITVYSFGGPRVGNSCFKRRCEELGVKVLRIVNINDPITKLPGVIFNEKFNVLGGKYELPWKNSCYVHVGVELALDFFDMQNPSCVHDLDTYIRSLKCSNRDHTRRNMVDVMNNIARKFLLRTQGVKASNLFNLRIDETLGL